MAIGLTSAAANLKVLIGGILSPSLVMDPNEAWMVYPWFEKMKTLMAEMGYFHLQATKPDTVGTTLFQSLFKK